MKKSKQTAKQKKAAHKRGTKRSQRLKETQKEKHLRKLALAHARKKAEERFEQQMKDLFGTK